MTKRQADFIKVAKQIHLQKIQQNEALLIIPKYPGMYAVLQRKSPIWNIYLLHQRTKEEQEKTIRTLGEQNVNWVILGDIYTKGVNNIHMRKTHNLLWEYLRSHFHTINVQGFPPGVFLLHRKSETTDP